MQPKIYLRYSPGQPGSVWTLFYIESDADIYGWHSEAKGQRLSVAFFMIENFYATRSPVLYHSVQDDVYGQWLTDSAPTKNEIRCPLPEPMRHELERLQSGFVQEWLFFENDPAAAAELAAYQSQGFSIQAANIKTRKLNRLDKDGASWVHRTSGMDLNVVDFLQKYWRFSEKTPAR